MNWLDSISMNLLQKDLDGLWQRQRAISDNLANFETPGYKAKTVSFEDELEKQLEGRRFQSKTRRETVEDLKNVTPRTEAREDDIFRLDGNGVDVEKENLELVRMQFNYMYSLRAMTDEFSRLRTAIRGGNS